MRSGIDTSFDFRSDTPPGKDPDASSLTLRRYHKELWSKHLPSGVVCELLDTTPRVYLHHRSEMGEFFLSSDAVIPSFTREQRIAHIVDQDFTAVRFFTPFDDFQAPPLPASKEAYLSYKQLAMTFVDARNRRIVEWSRGKS